LLKQDRVLGPAQAEISIVVWSDPECPYCKQFSGVPDAAVARANSGGTARAISRCACCPCPSTARRRWSARWARSAWPSRLARTATTSSWATISHAPAPMAGAFCQRRQCQKRQRQNDSGRAAVSDLAVKDGASDKGKLEACLRSDDTLGRIAAEGDLAEAADVEGTPAVALRNNLTGETILVNGAIDLTRSTRALP
jgi:hypothetical protein